MFIKWNLILTLKTIAMFCEYVNCLKFNQNYCELSERHVLCETVRHNAIFASKDVQYKLVEFTDSEKDGLLNIINELRQHVTLATSSTIESHKETDIASEVIRLKWNDDLQSAASVVSKLIRSKKPIKSDMMKFEALGGVREVAHEAIYVEVLRNETDFESELHRASQLEAKAMLANYNHTETHDLFITLAFSNARYIGCVHTIQRKHKVGLTSLISDLCVLWPSESSENNRMYQLDQHCSNCPYGLKCRHAIGDVLCIPTKRKQRQIREASNTTEETPTHESKGAVNSDQPKNLGTNEVSSRTESSAISEYENPILPSSSKFVHDCNKFPNHFLCDSYVHEISKVQQGCSNSTIEEIGNKVDVLLMFNNIRNDVALGSEKSVWKQDVDFDYNGIPSHGPKMTVADMIELEWDESFQRGAENFLKLCQPIFVDPSTMEFKSDSANGTVIAKIIKLNDTTFIDEDIRKSFSAAAGNFFAKNKNINNYTASEEYELFTVITYSKARYIGCGRIGRAGEEGSETACVVGPSEAIKDNRLFSQGKPLTLCKQNSTFPGLCRGDAFPPPKPEYRIEDIIKPMDYCPSHVLCDKFYNEKISKNEIGNKTLCKNAKEPIKEVVYTKNKIETILKVMNKLRNTLAIGSVIKGNFPEAADMMELEWDYELQEMAERYLYKCSVGLTDQSILTFGKNKDIFVSDIYPNYGQHTEDTSLFSAINQVLGEQGGNFTSGNIASFKYRYVYNLFTSLYNSRARYIGCARVTPSFRINPSSGERYDVSDQCFLMPSDKKIINQVSSNKLYLHGRSCSRCPYGSECSENPLYYGLCKAFPKNFGGMKRNDDYCQLHYQHVLCPTWPDIGNSVLCRDKHPKAMKPMDKLRIIKIYNDARSEIANNASKLPPAADMKELEWDDELERASKKITHKCSLKNQPAEVMTFGEFGEIQAIKVVLVYNNSGTVNEIALNNLIEEQSKLIGEKIPSGLTAAEWQERFLNMSATDPTYEALKAILSADSRYIGCAEISPAFYKPPNKTGDVLQTCLIAGTKNASRVGLYAIGESCTQCLPNYYCNNGLCKEDRSGIERPDRYCELGDYHFLCRGWDLKRRFGNCGSEKEKIALKEKDKEKILGSYNKFRESISTGENEFSLGPGANIIGLEWDTELQAAAEAILYNCVPESEASGFRSERLKFGKHFELQTIAVYLKHKGSNFEEELNKKIAEAGRSLKDAVPKIDTHNYKTSEKYGNFTALAFSESRFLGCARTSFLSNPTEIEEVCVLGATEKPDGNNDLFLEGVTCSQCPYGFKCANNLCWHPDSVMLITTTTPETTTTITTTTTTTSPPRLIAGLPEENYDFEPHIEIPEVSITKTTTVAVKAMAQKSRATKMKTINSMKFFLILFGVWVAF